VYDLASTMHVIAKKLSHTRISNTVITFIDHNGTHNCNVDAAITHISYHTNLVRSFVKGLLAWFDETSSIDLIELNHTEISIYTNKSLGSHWFTVSCTKIPMSVLESNLTPLIRIIKSLSSTLNYSVDVFLART